MGNRIFAVDMILNDFIRPMNQSAGFKDFRTACTFLFSLNSFLIPFTTKTGSIGIEDMADPDPPDADLADELRELEFYQKYFRRWLPLVMKAIGYGIVVELLAVREENEGLGK